jgi:hypothetical protein
VGVHLHPAAGKAIRSLQTMARRVGRQMRSKEHAAFVHAGPGSLLLFHLAGLHDVLEARRGRLRPARVA